MKRLWIGIGLLTVILVVGILVPEIMDACHEPVAEDLEQAAEFALADRWGEAVNLFHRAEEKWEEKKPVTASFAEHEPMDDIDGMFAQLEVYAAAGDAVSFSGTCVCLARYLDAIGDYHDLKLWNFF